MSLAEANNRLGLNLYKLLAEEKGNIFFSPLSISSSMTMLLCATEGKTESEMRVALGYEQDGISKNDVASVFEKYMSAVMTNLDSYTFSCANSLLSRKGFAIKERYKRMLVESFKALVLEVDFEAETQRAVRVINEWVKEKTTNMIPELITTLDPNTVFVFLNATYFKGCWMNKFWVEDTYLQNFYGGSENNAKEVEMMHLSFKSFPFYENETLKVLQLPYAGEEVAMLILLPRAKNGLESVESALTPSFVQNLKKKLRKVKVEVSLPRFRLEYTKSLLSLFQRLGVERVFNRGAELRIASDSPDLYVSEILHKAVLEVNEEGSEAAAATMGAVAMCAPAVPLFVADHPFYFVIYDTRSDLALYMGRVNDL